MAPLPPAASPPAGSPPAAAADAASGKPFEWPPSTRLSYSLTGDFRGPVEGSARVEWLRQGARYQVHLDVAIGPSFAPLVRRRMSSEGELTEQGLKPTRYEEETRVPLAATRRKSVAFEADRIVLQGPKSVPLLAGVQDTASQFVQLTWLFTTQPRRAHPHLLDQAQARELEARRAGDRGLVRPEPAVPARAHRDPPGCADLCRPAAAAPAAADGAMRACCCSAWGAPRADIVIGVIDPPAVCTP
jgi:hypothetical protein